MLGSPSRRPEIVGLTARIAGGNMIIRSLQIRSRENSRATQLNAYRW